jgi:hypothetical protein
VERPRTDASKLLLPGSGAPRILPITYMLGWDIMIPHAVCSVLPPPSRTSTMSSTGTSNLTTPLTPAEVATVMIQAAIAKHKMPPQVMFFKAFVAGVFLSFGGVLSLVLSGGAAGLTASNPGIVKILSGFVFPVGLVM